MLANADAVAGSLITQIFSKKKDLRLAKYAIHKVLFKLKVELPEDNPVRDCLPFYWYNYGPFSEVIESKINELKEADILKEYTTSEEKTILGLTKRLPPIKVEGIDEAIEKLNLIIQHVDFFHFDSFVNKLYREYAPCAFMPRFKLDFMNTIEAHVEKASFGQPTLDMFDGSYVDKLENILYDCEAELPLTSLFKQFNYSFSSFVTGVSRVFDRVREDFENLLYLNELVLHTAEVTWLSFAKGVRILDEGHDEYYNNRLEAWNGLYNKSLITFYAHVDNFNSSVLAELEPSRLPVSTPNERQKNILLSVVDGYLK